MLSQDIEAGHLHSGRPTLSILRQIYRYRKGKLGQVTVQFGDVINMNERFGDLSKV